MFQYPDLANNRTSVLVQSQVPEFVRNNYPTFIAFVEAYYEYLEQTGKLTNALKNIPNYLDVDYVVENNLTDFIEAFREMYLTTIPTSVLADKALLIKHIKEFYSSRGTTKSYKFLFRILFNEDVDTFDTGSQILRASAGKWYQPVILRIIPFNPNIINIGGGTPLDLFILGKNTLGTQALEPIAPVSAWVSTQIFGQTSFASAIVESATITTLPNLSYYELTLSNLTKEFLPSEIVLANNNGETLYGMVLGIVPGITVENPGSKYNVGDPVIITGGGGQNAAAIVSSVSPGSIVDLSVPFGGSGYQIFPSWVINVIGGGGTGVNAQIFTVDTSGTLTPNNFPIMDTTPNLAEVPLVSTVANTTVNNSSVIVTYGNCGPILIAHVVIGGQNYTSQPSINVTESILIGNSNTNLANLGAIGRFTVTNGGQNYNVGDDLVVINTTSRGTGGFGTVTSVNASGAITGTIVALPSVSGWANVTSGSNVVTGFDGSLFTTQLQANDNPTIPGSGTWIVINNELHQVHNIASATSLTVFNNFAANANNQVVRKYGYMLGGFGYMPQDFPNGFTITTRSLTGSGAVIIPEGILGEDAVLTTVGSVYGQIQTITMTDFGDHYTSAPTINLTESGDGTATAVADLISSTFRAPGYFLNEDGMLSARRYLEDQYTYNNYSYKIISPALVNSYYNTVYQILNPAGANMIGVTQIFRETGHIDISSNSGIFITSNTIVIDVNFILNISELS